MDTDVEINSDEAVALADVLIQLDRAIIGGDEGVIRTQLACVLDVTNPGWRDDEVVVGWVKDKGVIAAGQMFLRRHLR